MQLHVPVHECVFSLEKACYVLLAAGGPGERRGVVVKLAGHDEWMPPY